MAISKHALSELPLVKTVNDSIETFITDWQLAATQAITSFTPPTEDASNRQWWLAFGGNMIWAWAVFCPAGSAVAAAGSLIGAALAAGVASKLSSSPPADLATPAGKALVQRDLILQAGYASKIFKEVAPKWATDVLLPAILRGASDDLDRKSIKFQLRKKEYLRSHPNALLPAGFFLQDDELFSWFNGNDGNGGDDLIRANIWLFMFPNNRRLPYGNRRSGLYAYYLSLFQDNLDKYNNDVEIYEYNTRQFGKDASGNLIDKAKQMIEYRNSKPFVFRPYYGMLPGSKLAAAFKKP